MEKMAELYIEAFNGIFDEVNNVVKGFMKKVTKLFR